MNVMNEYFCTTSFSQPTGEGYFTVYAKDEQEARQKMQAHTKGKWCMLYKYRAVDVVPEYVVVIATHSFVHRYIVSLHSFLTESCDVSFAYPVVTNVGYQWFVNTLEIVEIGFPALRRRFELRHN